MKLRDEELQNQIEQGTVTPAGADSLAYRKVFDALQREPDFILSANFSDEVIAKIEAKKETSTDGVLIGFGVFAFVIAAIVSIALTNYRFGVGAFTFITSYAGLILFGIIFILGLHLIDKKIVRPSVS